MLHYTEDVIYHMEVDKRIPGNLLFSDGHSLKTANSQRTTLIVGNALTEGYQEGYGASARFSYIPSFYQMNTSHVLAVDHTNDCLRMIDRNNGKTSRFLGDCVHGRPDGGSWVDGADPRFYRPVSLLNYNNNGKYLYLSEAGNKAIRQIYLKEKYVYTLVQSESYGRLRFLAEDPFDHRMYLSSDDYVLKVVRTYSHTEITSLAGIPASNGLRDGSFSLTQFVMPRGIVALRNNKLVVADSDSRGRLRLLDLVTQTTSSICSRYYCDLDQPYSLALIGGYLYVGEYKKISRVTG